MKKLFLLLITALSISFVANAQVPQTDDEIINELAKQGLEPSDIKVRMLEVKHREDLLPMYKSINKLSENEKKNMQNFMRGVVERTAKAKERQGEEIKSTDGKMLGELMDDEYDASTYLPLEPTKPAQEEEKDEAAAENEQ